MATRRMRLTIEVEIECSRKEFNEAIRQNFLIATYGMNYIPGRLIYMSTELTDENLVVIRRRTN
jgi:hypothetical protein